MLYMTFFSKSAVISPMATAIWLIDNTSLSFKQIGDFCDFTETEIQLIADGVIGKGILPVDPTKNGNLTKQEIELRERDGGALNNAFNSLSGFVINIQKKKKYIPKLQRRSRPDAVLWLINYCPELSDAQIVKLTRTTKGTIQAIRNKEYSGYSDLVAKDPVILGFCSQKELDFAVKHAKDGKKNKVKKEKGKKVKTSAKNKRNK